jgi:hypothetical protein
MLNLMHFQSK